ncbi:LemA family protein [Sphingomonas daechungensis]|uniref:LemA family protein n=1 Tax=Sphingomonas daechungensis TaxID=1176646 RepID=A0ABX6SZ78_9SPHN|nr:LemA family protein [Sphingomonas daechungensis]QNP42601.1 LemA family protein [Sphingomonas daechungensis]
MGMLGWIVLAVVVLVLVLVIGIYNRLVRLRALVKEGFSGITVQLRRRADLIPNLVETVQGYATHEREVFEEVSKARAASVNAGGVEATAQADAQMTGILGRLFAVAEAYPELKANTNFLQLQDQLANIEGELQGARRYYNATVRDLNTSIQSFPAVMIARPMGFNEEPFYQDDDPAIQSAPRCPSRAKAPDSAWSVAGYHRHCVAGGSRAGQRRRTNSALHQRRPDPEGFFPPGH